MDIKFSDFPTVTVAGGAILGVGLQNSVNAKFALGSAAVEAVGTSGHVLPFLNGANTWSATQNFNVINLATPLGLGSGGTGAISAPGARTQLGLGTAAIANTGSGPGMVPILDLSGYLGIGVAPDGSSILHIKKDQPAATMALINNSNAAGFCAWQLTNDNNNAGFHLYGSGYAGAGIQKANAGLVWTGSSGGLGIGTFAAGPLFFGTVGTERMRIDPTGNVGIGTTNPTRKLEVTNSANTTTSLWIENSNAGPAADARWQLYNGTSATAGIRLSTTDATYPDAFMLYDNSQGGMVIRETNPKPIRFLTGDAERFQIDGTGLIGINSPPRLGWQASIIGSTPNGALFLAAVSTTGTLAEIAFYNATPPNDNVAKYMDGVDSVATRYAFYSNGGLANYQSNNVNLSDADLKAEITPYGDLEYAALEKSFTEINWGKWKYKDQTHTDWNHGYTAQGIQRAFATAAPELVDKSELGPKKADGTPGENLVVYDTDLTHIGMALLSRALKRIAELEAQVAQLIPQLERR
jgi:hypothetical protein